VILKAILFDFGGTLDADGVPWKERFFSLFRQEAGISADGFDRAFYDADDALVGRIPRTTSLARTARRVASGTAANLHLSDSLAAERVAERFLAEAFAKLEESADLLSRLALRFHLGVVSNFYGNLGTVCAETGLAWSLSVTVDSAVIGLRKPDRRIFEAALGSLGVQPEETLMVGDSWPRDMEGAKAAGLGRVWVVPEGGDASVAEEDVRIIRRVLDLEAIL
jgi:putative hydrolase of the HAD superfamily